MASAFTHAFSATVFARTFGYRGNDRLCGKFWVYSLVCSILPDADVVGLVFGIQYGDLWGHRGMSHSFLFAQWIFVGFVLVLARFGEFRKFSKKNWWILVFYFTFVTASHGAFDALTNGGLGVAFFSPFDTTRYFFPWTPVVVSPIETLSFFSQWGLNVIISEVLWIWIPLTGLYICFEPENGPMGSNQCKLVLSRRFRKPVSTTHN